VSLPDPAFAAGATHYRHQCRVLYSDTDAGGVVYYANYLRFMESARTEFMRDHVQPYSSLEKNGFILPVVECHIRYKASAQYDDLLIIETLLTEAKRISCRFDYRIVRERDAKLLAFGYTVHAVVTMDGKLTRFPALLFEKLQIIVDAVKK
jgi:acyl-CoA thioester hydrolase